MLVLSLFGCSGDSVHRSAEKLDDDPLDHNMFLNISESLFGCEETKEALDSVQFWRAQKAVYNCQGEGNTFVSMHPVIDKTDTLLHKLLSIAMLGLMAAYVLFAIKNRSTGTKILSLNTMSAFGGFLIHLFMRWNIRFIFALFIIVGYMLATGFMKEADNIKQFQDKSIQLPDLSVKNKFSKDLFDYLLCKNSTGFITNENPNLNIIKTGNGYKIQGQYKYCEYEGSFGIDTAGVEIAKANSFFDYEKMQEQVITTELQKLVERIDLIAKRASIAQNTLEVMRIPKILTCENTPVSYSGLSNEDKFNVIWKDIECATKPFVLALNKTSGMTEERLDTLATLTGSKKIHICDGEFVKQALTDKEGMLEKYRSCINTSCGGDASLYACGVALSKYNRIDQKVNLDFLTTSTFSIYDDEPEIRSAKMFTATLQGKTIFNKDPIPFTIDRNPIASLKVSVATDSKMSFQKVGDFLLILDILAEEKSVMEFSVWDFLSRQVDPGADGFIGTGRYFSCLSNPFGIFKGKYDCGGFIYESKLIANKFEAIYAQITLAKTLLSPKSSRAKLDKTDPAYTAASEGMKYAGIPKTAMAALLPFMFDEVGGLLFEDVYQENYSEIMGQKGEYYAAMTCIMSSKACADVLDSAGDALMIGVIVFGWIIPLTPFFIMATLIARYYSQSFIKPMLMVIKFIVKFGQNDQRPDLDKNEVLIECENLIISPLTISIGYVLSQIVFGIVAIFIIQDISAFTVSLIEIFSGDAGYIGDLLLTVFSLIYIYLFYMISMMSWVSYVRSVERSDGNVTTSDGRIQNAADLRRYRKATTGRGLE